MKVAFAVCGWAWLAIGVAFALGVSGSWTAMLAAAIATLWFLPFGTLLSLVQVVLLVALRQRLR